MEATGSARRRSVDHAQMILGDDNMPPVEGFSWRWVDRGKYGYWEGIPEQTAADACLVLAKAGMLPEITVEDLPAGITPPPSKR
jgi:hypothetical protein